MSHFNTFEALLQTRVSAQQKMTKRTRHGFWEPAQMKAAVCLRACKPWRHTEENTVYPLKKKAAFY